MKFDPRSKPRTLGGNVNGRNAQAPRPTANHALAVYDGQHLVGSVVERNGEFLAFDVHDHRVGVFANQREALRAIPAARSS
jgi:hypothetical protein